ncbi:RdRp [Botryosphaeria dothidea victorivirus 2]|uniref:RNA-directed RNA polymerase n=1 Tax=Botryosphaeria dothidea victorivirus 2 TaxID=2516210 RepID=A0A411EWI2_9VIRU|nr:RdRp [Botryosphaeria dothidea victorivirus 2]
MNKYAERAKQFGPLGDFLLSLITANPATTSLGSLSFVEALTRLRGMVDSYRRVDPLLPVAVSLLVLPFPLQVRLSFSDVNALLLRGCSIPFNFILSATHTSRAAEIVGRPITTPRAAARFARRLESSAAFRELCFPHKSLDAARSQPNLSLGALVRSFRMCAGSTLAGYFLASLAGHVPHDVAIAAILYAQGLQPHYGKKSHDIAAWLVLNPELGKGLSGALKAVGANAHPFAAVLCETIALQGRAHGSIDLNREAAYRCDPSQVAESVLDFGDTLRPHIEAVIAHELADRDVALPDLHSWWTSRWAWCVNGSQNNDSSAALKINTAAWGEYHSRAYRRMASEAVVNEPVSTWDGVTHISSSAKLEHGKTRAIFACDTRSYFAFEWLLTPVQKAWRNSRVLLDPGKGGHLGVANRIRGFMRHGGVNLMLDYDDFNSQHSLAAQKLLFEVLCARVNAPQWYASLLQDSWEKMYVKVDGKPRRWLGTLPSGHRGTTFVNSVLNAAYIRAAIGGPTYDALVSLHTGDDVYMRVDTLDACRDILSRVGKIGCRMNPSKQSVGFECAEFLRMAITPTHSIGYLARSIASFTSGNWVNLNPTDPADFLRSAILGTRSLCNRSGYNAYPRLIAPALRMPQPTSIRNLIRLLGGEVALDTSPVYNTDGVIRSFVTCGDIKEKMPLSERWPHHATNQYLAAHAAPIEVRALEMADTDVPKLMIASSYSKGHSFLRDVQFRSHVIKPGPTYRAYGYANASDLLKRTAERGVLTRYPLIALVKGRLNVEQVSELLAIAGAERGADPMVTAFGYDARPKNIVGTLSAADAGSLSKLTRSGNIFTLTPVCV